MIRYPKLTNSFIHLFIHSKIGKAPLQENYSEAQFLLYLQKGGSGP